MSLKFNFSVQQLIAYEGIKEESIANIKKWCAGQPLPQLTDELVALFLLSCSKDEERTKVTITSHYSIKNMAGEVFNRRSMTLPEIQEVLKIGYFCLMPRRTPDGCAIVYIKAKRKPEGVKHWSFKVMLKVICMVLDAAIFEYPPKNFIIIFDVEHVTVKHLVKFKPKVLKIFVRYLQEGFPSKLKAIHVVNMVAILNKTIKVLKPFVNKDVWEMTKFHSKDMDRRRFFAECVGEEYLPEELGGILGSIELVNEVTLRKLGAMEDFFLNEELYRHCGDDHSTDSDSESDEEHVLTECDSRTASC